MVSLRFLLTLMIVLLFVIPATHANATVVSQAIFHDTAPFSLLHQEGLHVSPTEYPGDSFSTGGECWAGSEKLSNVKITSDDLWLIDHEQSLGDLAPGVTKLLVTFRGQVPYDAPLGPHVIHFQCVANGTYVFASWTTTVQVQARPTRSTTSSSTSISSTTSSSTRSSSSTSSSFFTSSSSSSETTVFCDYADDRCLEGRRGGTRIECNEFPWSPFHSREFRGEEDPACGSWVDKLQRHMCVIATAAYGSEMAPEVVYMRTVRDGMIGSTPTGRVLRDAFSIWYYSWSPRVASWISTSDGLRAVFRVLLIPIVLIVQVTAFVFAAFGGGDLGAVVGFSVAALLSIGTYIILPAVLLVSIVTRLRKRFFAAKRWGSRDV